MHHFVIKIIEYRNGDTVCVTPFSFRCCCVNITYHICFMWVSVLMISFNFSSFSMPSFCATFSRDLPVHIYLAHSVSVNCVKSCRVHRACVLLLSPHQTRTQIYNGYFARWYTSKPHTTLGGAYKLKVYTCVSVEMNDFQNRPISITHNDVCRTCRYFVVV